MDRRRRAGSGRPKHWAYVKPVRPEIPAVKPEGWVKTPIDAFVLARLGQEGLEPSPEASREVLLRRVTLDLTGLPPTPAEIDTFLADTSADAYEKVVDRLLASPHYGERWARPWLDLARYADTNGYEKDRRRAAWKWRDWVIAAFNADMPFRQFTIEQIAGDMLKDAGRSPPASTATRCSTRRAASTSKRRAGRRSWTGSTPPPRCGSAPRSAARSATTTSSTPSPRRTTTGCSPSSTTASTASRARGRRSWTSGSSSPSWSWRPPRRPRARSRSRRRSPACRRGSRPGPPRSRRRKRRGSAIGPLLRRSGRRFDPPRQGPRAARRSRWRRTEASR
ncbi:MAG: hypothetical protein DMF81_19780 [Acidobacteria bacterium]|nr:MAG: hypothetical protein DMF81_19780 [Acidobacteriota bacterium]